MQKRALDDPASSTTSSPKRSLSEDPCDRGGASDGPYASSNIAASSADPLPANLGSSLALSDDQQKQRSSMLAPEEKVQMISNFQKQPLNVGDAWYLIDRRWFRRFQDLLGNGNDSPSSLGPIDNSRIALPSGRLKGRVGDDFEVEQVPQTAWDALSSWYGFNIAVKRKVIPGAQSGFERVEYYPPTITVLFIREENFPAPPHIASVKQPFVREFSASTKYTTFKSIALRPHYQVEPKQCRLWKLDTSIIPESSSNLAFSNSDDDDTLMNGPGATAPSVTNPFLTPAHARARNAVLIEAKDTPEETLEFLGLEDGDVLAAEWRAPQHGKWPMTPDEDALPPSSATMGAVTAVDPATTVTPVGPLFSQPSYVDGLGKTSLAPSSANNTGLASSVSSLSSTGSSGGHKIFGGFGGGISSMLTRSKTAGPSEKSRRGVMGLQNLGNTCFMNSAIQCMSNTTELNQYFLSGVFKDELNRENPLGMKGQVAEAFGTLVATLAHGTSSSFSPSDFKRTLARFAPAFIGYQQHDSQEFITFLLDGLHEDLNRIRKKPYVESPDWMGGGDEELARMARTCWEQYKRRNDSVIVDLFQGQYKSTLVCPTCAKVSITFDPFMYLTLPLPVKKRFETKIAFVPADPSKPRYEISISIPKDSSFKYLRDLVGKWFDIDPRRIIACEIYNNHVYKVFSSHHIVSEIATGDIVVLYEVSVPVAIKGAEGASIISDDQDHAIIPVFSALPPRPSRHQFSSYNNDHNQLFGAPFFITVNADQARDADYISDRILEQYARVLSPEAAELLLAENHPRRPSAGTASALSSGEAVVADESILECVIPLVTVDGAGDQVTEIHIDGPPSPVPAGPEETMSSAPETPTLSNASPMDVSELSNPAIDETDDASSSVVSPTLSPASPAPPTLRRAPVFSIQTFTDWRGDDESVPLGKSVSTNLETIYTAPMLGGASSSSSSRDVPPYLSTRMPGSLDPDSDDELNSPGPSTSTSFVSVGANPAANDPERLLVQPGKGLLCVWPPSLVASLFGQNKDDVFFQGLEPFSDPTAGAAEQQQTRQRARKTTITIEDCLDEFSKEETLGEDDLWYCSNCKEHKPATKKLEIWKAPDILVVHLKRFGAARNLRDKIDNLIEFPVQEFNLEDRILERKIATNLASQGSDIAALGLESIEEPLLYDLYGVDQHYGGLGGGHYTAVARNADDGKWYSFDDSRVTPISDPASIVTPAAYVLFYRRRTTRPIGGDSRRKAEQALYKARLASNPASAASSRPASPAPGAGAGLYSVPPSLPSSSGRNSPVLNHAPYLPPGYSAASSSSTSFHNTNTSRPNLSGVASFLPASSSGADVASHSSGFGLNAAPPTPTSDMDATLDEDDNLPSYDDEDIDDEWATASTEKQQLGEHYNSPHPVRDAAPGYLFGAEESEIGEFLAEVRRNGDQKDDIGGGKSTEGNTTTGTGSSSAMEVEAAGGGGAESSRDGSWVVLNNGAEAGAQQQPAP